MRSLLTTLKAAINNVDLDGQVPLLLFSFEHETLATPIRVVHNTEQIISGGVTYKPFPFECNLLSEQSGQVVSTTFTYYDIDLELTALVRSIKVDKPITVVGRLILASEPDNVQIGPFTWLCLEEAWNDKRVVELTVGPRILRGSAWPSHKMHPGNFRGIFGGSVT